MRRYFQNRLADFSHVTLWKSYWLLQVVRLPVCQLVNTATFFLVASLCSDLSTVIHKIIMDSSIRVAIVRDHTANQIPAGGLARSAYFERLQVDRAAGEQAIFAAICKVCVTNGRSTQS